MCSIDHKFALSHQQQELKIRHKEHSKQKEKFAFNLSFYKYKVMMEEYLWDEWEKYLKYLAQLPACNKHSYVYNKHCFTCHTT